MKHLWYTCLMVISLVPAFAQNEKNLVYDANIEQRNVTGFTAIDVSGAIDLYLSQGNEDAVGVSASSPEIIARMKTELRGNVLRIYFDNKGMSWKKWGNFKMKAYVTFKNLQNIESSGACNVKLTGVIRQEALRVQLSGASDFSGNMAVQQLSLELSGASLTKLEGEATNVSINTEGASEVKAYNLKSDKCKVSASGASSVRIIVNKELSANASGGSAIYFKGEGLIRDINTSGGATVKRRSDD